MVRMHLIGHPTVDCPPTTSPPPPPHSDPRFASIEVPQPTYVESFPSSPSSPGSPSQSIYSKPSCPFASPPRNASSGAPFPFDPLPSIQYGLASQQGDIDADMALSTRFLCGTGRRGASRG